jgi:hypothetical protein
MEVIENICFLVDDLDDLQSLAHVSCLFGSITCHMYATRLGIHVADASHFVHIQGNSFQALATWRRSRLFPCLHDKYLTCNIDNQDPKLADTQIKFLRHFLSMPFVGQPFVAVYIYSADALSLAAILQFIQLIDCVGCQMASIPSGLINPQWFNSSLSSGNLKLTTLSLSHLQSLQINHHYFSPRHWSSLLHHLAGPGIETLSIHRQPTIHALSKFLSRHSRIRRLHFQPCWATAHDQCMKSVGNPQ